jgi:hypothetical protein
VKTRDQTGDIIGVARIGRSPSRRSGEIARYEYFAVRSAACERGSDFNVTENFQQSPLDRRIEATRCALA